MSLITFIGGGKIVRAMVSNIIRSRLYKPSQIIVSDSKEKQNLYFREKWGIQTNPNNYDASSQSDTIILAVKPQSVDVVFKNLESISNKLILSVIAGVPLKNYEKFFHNSNNIVRIMPNTPCVIGEGMSVWHGKNITSPSKLIIENLLKSFGKELYVDNEKYIDIATAISGTGPLYSYLLAESMIDSAVFLGLSRDKSTELVYQTLVGSSQYMMQSSDHPAKLRNDITSPGGTTASALQILEISGFRTTISNSIQASYDKSKNLI